MMTSTMFGRSRPAAEATPWRYGASTAAAPAWRRARRVAGMCQVSARPRGGTSGPNYSLPGRGPALTAGERPVMSRAECVKSLVENEASSVGIDRQALGPVLDSLRLGFDLKGLGAALDRLGPRTRRG